MRGSAIFQALDDERHKVKRAPAAFLTYFEYLQWLEDAGAASMSAAALAPRSPRCADNPVPHCIAGLLSLVGRSIATSSFACSVLANRDGAVRVSEGPPLPSG